MEQQTPPLTTVTTYTATTTPITPGTAGNTPTPLNFRLLIIGTYLILMVAVILIVSGGVKMGTGLITSGVILFLFGLVGIAVFVSFCFFARKRARAHGYSSRAFPTTVTVVQPPQYNPSGPYSPVPTAIPSAPAQSPPEQDQDLQDKARHESAQDPPSYDEAAAMTAKN